MKPSASPEEPRSQDSRQVLSVTQVVDKLRRPLKEMQPFWIEGEISGLRNWRGYLFFSLKDQGAQIRCVFFGSGTSPYRPEKDGEKVLAFGRPEIFAKRGELQIQVLRVEPFGVGAMALALEKLKQKLLKEGVFKNNRPLPVFPAVVGIITSAQAAAFKDIQKMFSADPGLSVRLFPSRVQGEGAAAEIAAGITRLSGSKDVDVILLARGGGSQQDLWPFQSEIVARALWKSKIPTVSAVGHEIDTTVADLAADVRAATPTHGARLILDQRQAARDRVRTSIGVLSDMVRQVHREAESKIVGLAFSRWGGRLLQRLDRSKNGLDQAEKSLGTGLRKSAVMTRARAVELSLRLKGPLLRVLERNNNRLAQIQQNQGQSLSAIVERQRERLQRAVVGLEARSPLAVLARGFGIVRDKSTGKVLRNARRIKIGNLLELDLAQGSLDCRVEKVRLTRTILP